MNHRSEPRALQDECVHIQVQHGADSESIKGLVLHAQTHNVSASGINAMCASAIEVGVVLDILVECPNEPAYLLTTETRWCQAEPEGFSIGFQLIENAGTDIAKWRQRFEF